MERGNMDIPSTHVHDRSLSWLGTGTIHDGLLSWFGTGTSIKSGQLN